MPRLENGPALHLQSEREHQSRRWGDRVVGQVEMRQGVVFEQGDRQDLRRGRRKRRR